MKYLIAVAIGLLWSVNVYADEGMVITSKLDTLKGKYAFSFGDQYSNDGVSIKVGKKKSRFQAFQVREVISEDGERFFPIKMGGRYQFIKLLHDGSYLKLYGFNNPEYKGYDFGSELLVTMDGRQHVLGNIGYKKRLLEFLTDCPEVTDGINDNEMKKGDIEKIVDTYNICIDQSSQKEEMVIDAIIESAKIDELIASVQKLEIEDKQELIDMLVDVKGKLAEQKIIPSYLKGAIIEKLGDRQELIDSFNQMISVTEE